MSKTELLNKMTRTFNKAAFKFKKHSPEILVVGGVVGVVTSGVLACKATTKLDSILNEAKQDIEKIHDAIEHPEILPEKYTEEDGKKDLTIAYVQTGVKIVKLYAPSVALGAVSIAAMLKSNDILRKRNIALAAAYKAVDKSFKEYRGRVVERFGKDLDREMRFGIKAKEIDEVTVNEDGSESTTKKIVNVIDPSEYSDYARMFDCGNPGWDDTPEYTLMFLKHQQNYANERLKANGHLYLNEVYDMLGIPRSIAGQQVGWVYDEKHPLGDNFVDFGIFDVHKPKNRDFINGYEKAIILDFNVDGYILDSM